MSTTQQPFYNNDHCLRHRDNSISRDIEDPPYHDKISGTFHSLTGAQAFATVRSYLQTTNNHGENLLDVLHQLFTE